jgi:hypothetical protein
VRIAPPWLFICLYRRLVLILSVERFWILKGSIDMSGFLPTQVIERNLQFEPVWQVEICLEVRSIVAQIAPQAIERLVKNRLTYHDQTRGGPVKAGICGISLHQDLVRVHFIHGAFLEDPAGLLEGDRLAMRFLRIHNFNDAPWEEIRNLIQQSEAFRPTGELPGDL